MKALVNLHDERIDLKVCADPAAFAIDACDVACPFGLHLCEAKMVLLLAHCDCYYFPDGNRQESPIVAGHLDGG